MNLTRRMVIAALPLLIGVSAADAHVGLDYPVGGETFNEGDTVDVQWHIIIPHDLQNWDLYFSTDGGSTWQIVVLDLPPAQLDYQWIVPGIYTTHGKIRIYMDNSGFDYEDQSGNFTILVAGGCDYVTGDVNGSGGYNGLDVTYGVSFFKGGSLPQCAECPACSDWYYCGDVNGNCSYNGLDITYGVAYLKGEQSERVLCPDCPPAG